jgi:hypothetical protein
VLPEAVAMKRASCVVLGSRDDAHVQHVLGLTSIQAFVIDAETLAACAVSMGASWIDIETPQARWRLEASDRPIRGWVRRLAPDTWQEGIVGGSRSSAEQSAWLSLIAAIGRSSMLEWLTSVDDGLIAENKVHQLAVASAVGVRVPRTIVSNQSQQVLKAIPGSRIVKALGRAHYFDGEDARVVFAQGIDDDRLGDVEGGVPLIFQERLEAVAHLRVVTVCGRVWTSRLDASGLPLDWRAAATAHDSFEVAPTPSDVASGAEAVARALRLGYSSQDWIVTEDGSYLVDVNPGGQWLFLPEPTATDVALEIAAWLEGRQ